MDQNGSLLEEKDRDIRDLNSLSNTIIARQKMLCDLDFSEVDITVYVSLKCQYCIAAFFFLIGIYVVLENTVLYLEIRISQPSLYMCFRN